MPQPPPFGVRTPVIPRLPVVLPIEPVVCAVGKLGLEVKAAGEESAVVAAFEPGDSVLAGPAPDVIPVYVWL
jgi:hypothetical protein